MTLLSPRTGLVLSLLALVSLLLVSVPEIDLSISRHFWRENEGFPWRLNPVTYGLHVAIQWSARVMAVLFLIGLVLSTLRRGAFLLRSRGWAFLLAALLIGPGLVVNLVLKDNWDRARPHQIEQFGGQAKFSPPLLVSDQCERNCSFVSGDAALGFFVHSFAYVVPRRRGRAVLIAGLGTGAAAGLLRIGMGAHFFSDVLFAGLVVLAISAMLHALLFGAAATTELWRHWFGRAADMSPESTHR